MLAQAAQPFPDEQIVATLSQQLSWSHFVEILSLKEPLIPIAENKYIFKRVKASGFDAAQICIYFLRLV